jgi:hypothetical protein
VTRSGHPWNFDRTVTVTATPSWAGSAASEAPDKLPHFPADPNLQDHRPK